MKLLSPTQNHWLNEIIGFMLLSLGLVIFLSLVSYHVQDPSLDTAASSRPLNLVGYPGSYLADLSFQLFGAASFLFPPMAFLLAWKWIRSEEMQAGSAKIIGFAMLTLSLAGGLSFLPLHLYGGTIPIGGTLGLVLANRLVDNLNPTGALLATLTTVTISLYLVSTFTLAKLAGWFAGPIGWFGARADAFREWRERERARSIEKAHERKQRRLEKAAIKKENDLSLIHI